MARPLRIEYPGAWYHVTSRGNEKSAIYRNDGDRWVFLKILKESLESFRVEVHCYVLMLTHFHLLLTTPLGNLSRFMQRLNTAYTVYFNGRHDRVGHLFQGRYKAILVDADSYLLELSRYIHLNPVRLNSFRDKPIGEIIDILEAYRWSSYRCYIGKARRADFLHTDKIIRMISTNVREGPGEYRKFVLEGLREKIKSPLGDKKGQLVLGKPSFVKWAYKTFIEEKKKDKEYTRLEKSLPEFTMQQIARSVSDEFEVDPDEIIRNRSNHRLARQVLIELCCRYLVRKKSLREIGKSVGGISVSGIGASRKRLKRLMEGNDQLTRRINKINDALFS